MTVAPTTRAPVIHSQPTGPEIPKQRIRGGAAAERSARLLRDTPGRLALALAAVLALIAITGVSGFADTTSRSTTIDEASGQRGRMAIAAFNMYRALSDADAAATSAFLPGLTSHEELGDDYATGISRASTAITTLAAEAESKDQATTVAELSASLPVYTGLIETARTYHRQGLPLGLAYLRDASTLVQEDMLPKINDLQSSSMDNLAGAKSDATAFPWLAGAAALATLAVLVYVQVNVSRRSNRFLNIGLVTATVAVLASSGWLLVSWNSAAGHMDTAHHNGAEPLALLSEAHIGAQQARSDEALTLIAQGANTDYEAEYTKIMTDLIGEDGDGGTLGKVAADFDDPELSAYVADAIEAARQWDEAHTELRKADDAGNYTSAVSSATSTDADTAGAAFQALDEALTKANDLASKRFTTETDAAGAALTGSRLGIAVLCLIAMITGALGIQRRISEYR